MDTNMRNNNNSGGTKIAVVGMIVLFGCFAYGILSSGVFQQLGS